MDAQKNLATSPDRPGELLPPEGLVGDVANWIIDAAGCYQPNFALAAALTACGALVGRGVKDFTGQRTNLYSLAIGRTSSGKNEPLKCIDALFRALRFEKVLKGKITSDSALEVLLLYHPVMFLKIDEIGHYVKNLKGAGQSNGHLKSVMPALTEVWSAAGGVWEGKTRAENQNGKWTPGKHIEEPCVCLYGATAPDVLFDCMNASDMADGSFPRFLVFRSDTVPRRETKPEISVPPGLRDSIADALKHLGIPLPGTKSQDGKVADIPTAMLVNETDEAQWEFESLEDGKCHHIETAQNPMIAEIWGKAVENARRVALTVAVFRNPSAPKIEEYDAKYAVQLVQQLVSGMCKTVAECVSSTRVERTKKRLLRLIRRAGANGLTRSQLVRSTDDLDIRERNAALDDLEEGEQIMSVTVRTKTKPMIVFKANDSK